MFPKVAQIDSTAVFTKRTPFSKQPKKSQMFLGYFCKQICCQELSKISQSGYTVSFGLNARLDCAINKLFLMQAVTCKIQSPVFSLVNSVAMELFCRLKEPYRPKWRSVGRLKYEKSLQKGGQIVLAYYPVAPGSIPKHNSFFNLYLNCDEKRMKINTKRRVWADTPTIELLAAYIVVVPHLIHYKQLLTTVVSKQILAILSKNNCKNICQQETVSSIANNRCQQATVSKSCSQPTVNNSCQLLLVTVSCRC